MPTCSAFGCSNNSKSGYKLYRLPVGKRNEERRKLWLHRIGRDKWIPNENTKLCEAHFTVDQFENNRADSRRLLKQTAIPSVFCHRRPQKSRKPSKYVLLKDPTINKGHSVNSSEDNNIGNYDQDSAETPECQAVLSQNIGNDDLDTAADPEFEAAQSENAPGKPSKDPSNPDYVPSIFKKSNSKRNASTKTLKTPETGETTSEKDDKSQIWPSLLNLHPISSEASTSGVSTAPKPQQSTTNPTAAKPELLSTKADESGASKPNERSILGRKRPLSPSPAPNASGGATKEDPDKLCIIKMEIEDDGYAENEEESFLASLTSSSSQRSQDSTPADSPDCYPPSMRTETNQEIVPTLPKIVPAINESDELLLNGIEHPVEVFFRDIAQTVMQFPPHLIEETKTKVSSLVYDMVVRSISEGFTNMKQQAL